MKKNSLELSSKERFRIFRQRERIYETMNLRKKRSLQTIIGKKMIIPTDS